MIIILFYNIVLNNCDKNTSLYKSVDNSSTYYDLTIANFVFNGVAILLLYIRYPFICHKCCDCCYWPGQESIC